MFILKLNSCHEQIFFSYNEKGAYKTFNKDNLMGCFVIENLTHTLIFLSPESVLNMIVVRSVFGVNTIHEAKIINKNKSLYPSLFEEINKKYLNINVDFSIPLDKELNRQISKLVIENETRGQTILI